MQEYSAPCNAGTRSFHSSFRDPYKTTVSSSLFDPLKSLPALPSLWRSLEPGFLFSSQTLHKKLLATGLAAPDAFTFAFSRCDCAAQECFRSSGHAKCGIAHTNAARFRKRSSEVSSRTRTAWPNLIYLMCVEARRKPQPPAQFLQNAFLFFKAAGAEGEQLT